MMDNNETGEGQVQLMIPVQKQDKISRRKRKGQHLGCRGICVYLRKEWDPKSH